MYIERIDYNKRYIYIYYPLTSINMNKQNDFSVLIDTLEYQKKYGIDIYVKDRVNSLTNINTEQVS